MRRGKRRAWRDDFLVVLATLGGNVSQAAIAVGVSRHSIYTARRRHPDFARAIDAVLAAAQVEADKAEVERRARLALEHQERLRATDRARRRSDRDRLAQALRRMLEVG